ncbi:MULTISPECIES: maleylpyruvate isomerase family mycothiol-dependent enzyme [Kitasatospora]|uniref:Maleylpyruvate isomerase family mycothiol-dependent enzyme n=1 Tax=Kitasatospora cystarginea TaxID=58350 RepID=A0ABN3EN09_9ACTN
MTKPRVYDPVKVRAALAGQAEVLRGAVRELCARPDAEEMLNRPTRLGDWKVRQLVAHLGQALEMLPGRLDGPVPGGDPLPLVEWVGLTRTAAAAVEEMVEEHARKAFGGTPEEVAREFDRAADALLSALDRPEVAEPGRKFASRFGPILMTDVLVTRLVEAVVHADDLADALGLAGFPHVKQAVAAVTRLLADAFAAQVPGGSVELRIPPYAVVQAVPGPRHTRGTPPNVVETDPLSWIRLATGRTDWAAAVESTAVSASGERSDLSGYLPVMG